MIGSIRIVQEEVWMSRNDIGRNGRGWRSWLVRTDAWNGTFSCGVNVEEERYMKIMKFT
jgi:hypothetical protein